MANEQLIVQNKLSFFQRIKKSSLIKKINIENYKKAPDYLKNDDDVIRALIFENPQNIELFDIEKRVDIAHKIADIFSILSFENTIEIINNEPSFILKLGSAKRLSYVLSKQKNEFLRVLPEEEQFKLLTEHVEYKNERFISSYQLKSDPFDYYNKLELFSLPVVKRAIKNVLEKNAENNSAKETIISNLEISKLPVEAQLEIVSYDELLAKKMSVEAAIEYVGKNPMLLNKLENKTLIEVIKKQPEFFKVLNDGKKSYLLESDFELKNIVNDEEKLKYSNRTYNGKLIDNPEVIKRSFIDAPWIRNGNITDVVRNAKTLIELGRFDSIALSTSGIENIAKAFGKMEHVVNLYKNNITDVALLKELDDLPKKICEMDSIQRREITENLPKIFLNEKVMESVKPELLIEFLQNPNDMNIVKNIIAITYGEQTREIFADRPGIKLEHIKTLDIFDSKITERYGVGLVHNLLSYDTYATNILGELVRNPDKFKKFERFEQLFNREENHILDFNNDLITYKKFENLLTNIDLENLTDAQKENLLLAVNDLNMSVGQNETSIIPLETIEDLENYSQIRNEMYRDYLEKTDNISGIKNAISRRFFGLQYYGKFGAYSKYQQTALSMDDMINYYNLENFVKDERTIESELFTEEDLDMLELMNIVDKIGDSNVLKQLYKELENSKNILTPVDFNDVKKKIPQQYSKELVNSLLTVESAKERAEKGEDGISYEVDENGFEIINLHGADFRLLMHTMGMNNSGLNVPRDKTKDIIWKTFEEGCSTISGCVIEPGMLHSCNNPLMINLGFANIGPKQIIGMSHHDAHVSHIKRKIDPEFEYSSVKFNYPEELVRKTAAQITGQEQSDPSHPYNEVAMYRKNVDSSQIKNGEFGGRIMPDYIVVYGKANGEHYGLAKAFSKNGKPIPIIEIDEKAYGDRTWTRGSTKENHTKKREEGKIVKKAKEMVEDER